MHKDNRFTKDELTNCQHRNFTEVNVSLWSVWGDNRDLEPAQRQGEMIEKEWLFRTVPRALYGEVVMRALPAYIDGSQSLVLVLATVWRSSCTWSQCGTSDARL